MATFTTTWNAAFEALPPDTGENASLGASRIRDHKKSVRERLEIDHYLAGDAHDGKHKKITVKVQGSDPTLDTGDGALYSKTVSSTTELFYKDNNATVLQMTSGGELLYFPSGTRMLFQQTAAPTGWTKDTSDTNERALRVVSGTVSSGGTSNFTSVFGASTVTGATSPGTNTVADHDHSGTTGNDGGHTHVVASNGAHDHGSLTGNHTLTIDEMPAHDHVLAASSVGIVSVGTTSIHYNAGSTWSNGVKQFSNTGAIEDTGGGNAHNHSIGTDGSHIHGLTSELDHNHTVAADGAHSHTVNSHTHTTSMDILYLDVIIAEKD